MTIYDYEIYKDLNTTGNKLFCTFSQEEDLDTLIKEIICKYTILYNKIFILFIKENNEYVCTYNLDLNNVNQILHNTISVHRKKDFNVLYTINSLNQVIKEHNNGKIDNNFEINWCNYRNSILLTQNSKLKQLETKLHRIIEI